MDIKDNAQLELKRGTSGNQLREQALHKGREFFVSGDKEGMPEKGNGELCHGVLGSCRRPE